MLVHWSHMLTAHFTQFLSHRALVTGLCPLMLVTCRECPRHNMRNFIPLVEFLRWHHYEHTLTSAQENARVNLIIDNIGLWGTRPRPEHYYNMGVCRIISTYLVLTKILVFSAS